MHFVPCFRAFPSWYVTMFRLQRIEWFRIDYLPCHKRDLVCKEHYDLHPNNFFMVIPYIKSVSPAHCAQCTILVKLFDMIM